MLVGLVQAKIKFVVVGGVAASTHGAARITDDLDIVYDSEDRQNVITLAALLASWNAYPRGMEAGLPFVMDHQTMRLAPIMTLSSREGKIDVLANISGVGNYNAALRHAEEVDAFGTKFLVLELPTLIKAKRAAGRSRDFEHLIELEALLELKRRGTTK